VHNRIGALPDRIGLCLLATVPPPCPALASTVTSRQSLILSGNAPIPSCTPPPMASREAGPPSGGHRRPPGGSESLRKILTIPPHGQRANSTVPPPCPSLAGTVASGQRPIPSGNAPGLRWGRATLQRPPAASRWLGEPSKNSDDTPHRRRPVPPFPALAGRVASGQSPIPSGNAPILSCTPPCPTLAGTVASGQSPIPSGNAPGLWRGRATLRRPPAASRRLGEPS